ncbi:histidinol-phosphatase HisJ family protein [Virgibacillus sp. 179-BFC.A HS]|uniref:Histidinol-phosphatase n=1 Tax=Tigheibacillus jepli TaxID=3035914 RepID=A0ABU5CKD0_9BACI|nr:histidinol-phosphatase HisJ family protein [Virgibacillus sp. 179-BFC.A HS]MDY0406822.1 histidinol-phosphatase HisJ family protein [Virgibacillus sp. 179-BFC.A HS]
MFDYHMHSDFSADCGTPMGETIESAIEKGLEEICFTEHIDYEYPDPTIDFELDLSAYDAKIREMQAAYAGQIRIKKGVEIGVQPYLLPKYESLLRKESFDFVICSMHTTQKKDLHSGAFFAGKTEEAYKIYYMELLECVRRFSMFQILGHVDLVKRYTKEKSKLDYHDLLQEIFQTIISRGQGIELNTSGYRYGLDSGMPSKDILQLYKDCDGEVITLGSDSHVAETIAYRFRESLELLKQIGFRYIATFENGKPTFHPIERL